MRLIICAVLLLLFVAAARYLLLYAFGALGFWPGMAICLAVGCSAIAAAFAYDRASSRSQ